MASMDARGRGWRSRWAAVGAAVAVTFGAGGLVAVHAAGGVDSTTVLTDPVRVLDSRDPVNVGLSGPFSSQVSQKLQITGPIPTTSGTKTVVPSGATGVLLNVTVVNSMANGFISIRPGDATGLPTTSSLNFNAGQVVPNAVLVALPTAGGNDGKIEITYDAYGQAGPTTDILVDVVGYASSSTLAELQSKISTKADSTQTVVSDGRGLVLNQLAKDKGSSNGCTVSYDGRTGYLPLEIPVGSTILNVTGSFYDDAGASTYTALLYREERVNGGSSTQQTLLKTVTGGELSVKIAEKDLTPDAEVVGPGESFEVYFDDGVDSFGNGLCFVRVTYLQPTGVGALLEPTVPTDAVTPFECADDEVTCRVETP